MYKKHQMANMNDDNFLTMPTMETFDPSMESVGVNTIIATKSFPNYNDISVSRTIVITKAPFPLEFVTISVSFDLLYQSVDVSSSLFGGSESENYLTDFTSSTPNTYFIDSTFYYQVPGTYEIRAVRGNSNYEGTTNGTIIINRLYQEPLLIEDGYLSAKGGNLLDLKNHVFGGSGQGAYQYAVAQNGKILSLSENSRFSFPSGEGTYIIQVKKYADVFYEEQLSNIATFTVKQMDIISTQYKTSFTLSANEIVTTFGNRSMQTMLSYIKEIVDTSLIHEYTEQIVEQVFEKINITRFMIYSTLPFGAATNTILLKPNLAHILESMVDSAFMPRWASSGSISFPTKLGDFLKVSISGNTLDIFSANSGGIIKTLEKGDSFVYEEKYLIKAGSIYIERIPDPKNCPIPAIPIEKTNLSQKQKYAGFVRNSTYKQVVVGPASNIVISDITNSYFTFTFDTLGYPIEYTYSIKDINTTITKYTVSSDAGAAFTFNGLNPNSTYYLEVWVKYANIIQPFGILNAIIVNTLNEIELKDFSYVSQNNSITISFNQPENKPGKFAVRWRELLDASVSGEIEIRNVYVKYFYDRKSVTFTDLKIGISYEIYVDTYFTYSDGNFKEPLSSHTKIISTIYESSLDISMTTITGNSLFMQFVDNLNTATQPIRYYTEITKTRLTEEGKLIEISSTKMIFDSSSNISRHITGLEKNTRYNVFTTIGYITGNEYSDSSPYFYTRNEGPITNFSYDMFNTYGTLFFDSSLTTTVDISFASLNYTLSGDVSEFSVQGLDISRSYSINIKTSYVHDTTQTNVYDFSGVFYTLNEGPCLDISFLDINAFDVDCSFSDLYSPDYYTITRKAPDGQTQTLTAVQPKRFQFSDLFHHTEYIITIESFFSNHHTYIISRSFRTKNEGPLTNVYSYQYNTKLYLFVDFSSNTFTDMSNVVSVGVPGETFDLTNYPFKTLIYF